MEEEEKEKEKEKKVNLPYYACGRSNNRPAFPAHSRSVELKASTIRQHYYPEGGWGWIILITASLVHLLTSGLQLSYGIMLLHLLRQQFMDEEGEAGASLIDGVWMGSLSYSLSLFMSPIVVAFCRRKSTRLTGIFGGLIASLGCLFASFASQFHQVMLSYGLFLGFGLGAAREASNLMVGQYFKRKRELVEIFLQSAIGLGISIMSPIIDVSLGTLGWRRGLQTLALVLFVIFLVGTLYRSASLYHPQRRAILHLKTQRRKIRDKAGLHNKPPFFDFSPLKGKSLRVIMISMALCSFGYLSPIFYMADSCRRAPHQEEGDAFTSSQSLPGSVMNGGDNTTISHGEKMPTISPSNPVHKQTLYLHVSVGLSFSVGIIFYGCLTIRSSAECRISRKYLSQSALLGLALTIAALAAIGGEGCSGPNLVLLLIYATFLGSLHYAAKMLVYERVRARFFNRSWSFVQWAQAIPVLVGVPLTGYLNGFTDILGGKSGLMLSALSCFLGAVALTLVPVKDQGNELSRKAKVNHQHSCSEKESGFKEQSNDGHELLNPLASSSDSGRIDSNDNSGANSGGATVSSQCSRCGQHFLLLVNYGNQLGPEATMLLSNRAWDEGEEPRPAKRHRTDREDEDWEESYREDEVQGEGDNERAGGGHYEEDDDDLDEDLVALSKFMNNEKGTFFSEYMVFNPNSSHDGEDGDGDEDGDGNDDGEEQKEHICPSHRLEQAANGKRLHSQVTDSKKANLLEKGVRSVSPSLASASSRKDGEWDGNCDIRKPFRRTFETVAETEEGTSAI